MNSTYSSAYSNKGFLLAEKLKKYDQAINYYLRAIELSPKCAEYYLGTGYCLHKIERFVEAISMYKKAAELEPNDPTIFTNIGCSLIQLSIMMSFKKTIRMNHLFNFF